MDKNRFFEGCGKEGPIRSIFFCEFHPTAGPKISCQVPADFISKDTFEAVSVYLITKAQLLRSTLTITTCGIKILGFPVRIDNKKYPRNAFHFNMCFVCDSWARTVQYESVVKKLSDFLTALEVESSFLSTREDNQLNSIRLTEMMTQALHDLNSTGTCTLTEGSSSTHLKVTKLRSDPPSVLDHQVPVIVDNLETYQSEQWDLTTQQILPYVDGINHVAKIAALADVENNLVKTCLQNLVYYGVISMVPIFQYSNCYAVTSKLRKLAIEKRLQDDCLRAVSRSSWQLPHFRDVFKVYCSMNHGTTVKDICLRFNLQVLRIDERKLVQFGLIEGLIRRIHKYPTMVMEGGSGEAASLYPHFTGSYSYDEICCRLGMSALQLDAMVEKDPNVTVVYRLGSFLELGLSEEILIFETTGSGTEGLGYLGIHSCNRGQVVPEDVGECADESVAPFEIQDGFEKLMFPPAISHSRSPRRRSKKPKTTEQLTSHWTRKKINGSYFLHCGLNYFNTSRIL